MAKRSDVPAFGVLNGVKVVSATLSTAGPFAAELMAEMGADVIWIENANAFDVCRLPNPYAVGLANESERRNQRSISMNTATPEGREILARLVKDADIFIEASKGGQYTKWGMTDEWFWEINPKLVILHISGFGQSGDPDFIGRGCYDPIAQAFSGLMSLQGWPDRDMIAAQYLTTDYMTGYCAAAAAIGALFNAARTGKGESVDLAQFEVALRAQGDKMPMYMNAGVQAKREGTRNWNASGWGTYKCMDGNYVYLLCLGVPIIRKVCGILGLPYGNEDFPAGMPKIAKGTPASEQFEAAVEAYCATHTAQEMENDFWPQGVPCCKVMTYADMLDHPHYLKRGSLVQWPAVEGSAYEGHMLTGAASPLRFKNNPTQIWRGAPTIGMDTDDILADAGFTDDEISAMYEKKVVKKAAPSERKLTPIERDLSVKE